LLRFLVLLLLAANLLFLAWTQGWLLPVFAPPMHGHREPERLATQVRPEAVALLAPQAASVALAQAAAASEAAQRVCLLAGPFADAEIAAAEAAVNAASLPTGSWAREPADPTTPRYMVYLGRFTDRELMRTRAEELRKLDLSPEEATGPTFAPGLVLGRHVTRQAAEEALTDAQARGVRGARIVDLPGPPAKYFLRVPAADPQARGRLVALKGGALRDGFSPCPAP
jgi:hypothetical protein